ncbi:MAG: DUF1579 domain-containing protein [Phycisphaerales bacterium JB059]
MGCDTTPGREHEWLQQLVGTWAFEGECDMGPDQPKMKHSGTETVRSLGGLWIVCEGRGAMPGGEGEMSMQTTLGYDPARERYVGNWVGSVMTHMFIYEGTLEDNNKILPLNTEGPSFTDPKVMAAYQDVIEIVDENTRLLRSRTPGPDGGWVEFMVARYVRT